MINDDREDTLPPIVVPPVRRDPNIGIRRDQTPFSAPRVSAPDTEERILYKIGTGLVATIAIVLLLIVAGVAAHGIWRAILIGWGIG